MKRLLTSIRTYWFTPLPPERLALIRIATGLFSLWYLWSRFGMLQRMAASDRNNFEPIGILEYMQAPIPPEVFWWITVLLMALNLTYIAGWKFRLTGPAFAIGMFLFFTYRNSWSMIYHNRNALVLHVCILGLVASADALSVDATRRRRAKGDRPRPHWRYGWPIRLLCAATVSMYFLSGVAKLAGDLALDWATGSAMRSQIAVDAIRKEVLGSPAPEFFDLIYPHTWLFLGMGILTFVLELGAPLALGGKRLGKVWAVLTWMMHWGIFFIMGIRFGYQMTGLVFLSFFDIERLLIRRDQAPGQEGVPQASSPQTAARPVVLFDGACNLCNASVRFILRRDREQRLRFASQQSAVGKALMNAHGVAPDGQTMVLIENGQAYTRSEAALRIGHYLSWPWRAGPLLLRIPRPWRDRTYNWIAANRYRWFGRNTSCAWIPQMDQSRILDR